MALISYPLVLEILTCKSLSCTIILFGALCSNQKAKIPMSKSFIVFPFDGPASLQYGNRTVFLSIIIPLATSLSFNFPSFDDTSKIIFEGDAGTNGSTIMLTKEGANLASASRITYNEPLLLWNDNTKELTNFTTQFSFIIDSNETNYADGFAFLLAPYPARLPLFAKGGYLGLYSNTTILNQNISTVAVEFDTFTNNEWDPKGEHLGIDINSINSSTYIPWNSSIREHRIGNARVNYDSITHNLSLFLTYPETNQSPSANYSLSYIVDLREALPGLVTVGFSAATGNFTETHTILSWSFNSTLYSKAKFLQWPARHRIAMGLASALFYLHEEGQQCVVHRDIKPSNVMLDSAFNAKLGDFGLARLVDHDSDLQTTDLAGTRGYMAPECFYTGKASKESDVYSFGIVALEIACGRRTIEPNEQQSKTRLAEWVWNLYGRGKILDAVDERLEGNFEERQIESLMVVGLWCSHPDSSLRPSIKQVISALSFDAPFPVLPPKRPVPMYFAPEFEMFAAGETSSVANSAPSGQFTHSFEFTLSPDSLLKSISET